MRNFPEPYRERTSGACWRQSQLQMQQASQVRRCLAVPGATNSKAANFGRGVYRCIVGLGLFCKGAAATFESTSR